MIPVSSFADRSVAVVGLGRSGLATARALAMGGARVWAWDDNERARSTALDEGFDVFEPAPERMAGTSAVVLSPGIPLTHPTPHPVVALARYPNAYAKLTFLPVASRERFPFADVHGMVRQVVDAFGPERCLFGCNFPTAQYCPDITYTQAVELFAEVVDLSPGEREWILGGTAAALWGWG